jgi:hypothetical protein
MSLNAATTAATQATRANSRTQQERYRTEQWDLVQFCNRIAHTLRHSCKCWGYSLTVTSFIYASKLSYDFWCKAKESSVCGYAQKGGFAPQD